MNECERGVHRLSLFIWYRFLGLKIKLCHHCPSIITLFALLAMLYPYNDLSLPWSKPIRVQLRGFLRADYMTLMTINSSDCIT